MGVTMKKLFDSPRNRDYWRALMDAALNLWIPRAIKLLSTYWEIHICIEFEIICFTFNLIFQILSCWKRMRFVP